MSSRNPPLAALRLAAFGVLRMRGSDAAKFLQGYLTCDLDELTPTHWQYGALCTREGRVVATTLVSGSADDVRMRLPRAVLPELQQTLAKYAVFARAKLVDDSANWQGVGMLATDADTLTANLVELISAADATDFPSRLASDEFELLRRAPNRCELWWPSASPGATKFEAWLAAAARLTDAQWCGCDIAAGWPIVDTSSTGEYLPQSLNLDRIHAVSFTKGCYLGQEIVTRLQHRGNAKQRLLRFALAGGDDTAPPPLGVDGKATAVTDARGAKVGEVLQWGTAADNTTELLAVVDRRAAVAELQVGGLPVELRNLPYSLDD